MNHARTRVRRLPERQVTDRATLNDLLDATVYCHVGVALDDGVHVLPMAHARDGDTLLVHGSTGSRLMRALAEGAGACVTVTEVTGIVVARSAFDSSMHYRSAVIYGTFHPIVEQGSAELGQGSPGAVAALDRLTETLIPGRSAEIRPPTARELAATMILAMPLTEWALKVGAKHPDDPAEERGQQVWAGWVPLTSRAGTPVPADEESAGLPVPASVQALVERVNARP